MQDRRRVSSLWLSLITVLILGACGGKTEHSPVASAGQMAGKAVSVAPLAAPTSPTIPAGIFKAAFLVPLSGSNAPLGQAMLNAAQMALFDSGNDNFELLPRDTGDTPEGAIAALRDAAQSGARIIIGPVFGAQAAAIKPEAGSAKLDILALSNDASLAAPGLYIAGFTPSDQVRRIADFARANNAMRFAALIPEGAYGDIVAAALQNALNHNGGVLARLSRYNPEAADLNPVMQELAAEKDQIDALFLADGGVGLRRIAAMLPAFQLNGERIRLLGTGLWDEDNFGRLNPQLVGGWFAAPDARERNRFMDRYRSTYGAAPPRLATLGYDVTALTAALAHRDSAIDRAALARPAGFNGIDGIFRFDSHGIAERGLAVYQVSAYGATVLDPAPASFAPSMTY